MSEGQPRNDAGRFGEKVTEQDILKIFDTADEPFMTTTEIANELPVSREAVYYRLSQMLEKGDVGKKKAGARSVGWWAEVAPRLSPEAQRQADAASRENTVSQDEMKRRLGMDG
ncbi:helix-turn-helix domain-containing protein (plasmid) [Haloferacaceae archaeon DSL9]